MLRARLTPPVCAISWRAGNRFTRASYVFCQLLPRSSSAEDVTRPAKRRHRSPHYAATSAGSANFSGQRVFARHVTKVFVAPIRRLLPVANPLFFAHQERAICLWEIDPGRSSA
jgi:hypothetical protein